MAGTVGCIYSAQFSPHVPNSILSVAGPINALDISPSTDVVVLDTLLPPDQVALRIPQAHSGAEVLSVDWNKYDPNIIATSGTAQDMAVKVWDLRMLSNDPFRVN